MNRKQFLYNEPMANRWRSDEDDEKDDQPKSDLMMLSKKIEKYFFDFTDNF